MNDKKKSILLILFACILITFVSTACSISKVASQKMISSDEDTILTDSLTEHGLKSEETYTITDQNKNFVLKNGCALIFTKEEEWKLNKGDKETLEVELSNTEFNIEIGYMKDNGNMNLLFSGLPERTLTVDFAAPDDGYYAFYLLGISSDDVAIKQVSLK